MTHTLTRRPIVFLVIFASLFFPYSSSFGLRGDPETARLSLKGLKGVTVLITFSTGELDKIVTGLSGEVIKTDVELKLRMAGINTVSKEDIHKIPGVPQLLIQIHGHVTSINQATQDKQIVFAIDIALFQSAYLARDIQLTSLPSLAVTWSHGAIGWGYTNQDIGTQIRNLNKDLVDAFINDYLSVNPKGGK